MTQKIIENISADKHTHVINRDLNNHLPFIDEQWVNANFTAAEDRSSEDNQKLSLSDALVKELQDADAIVIGSPIYNFSIAASLKAWIDMVARAGVTFKYTSSGPVGLLKNKKVYVAVASGGVQWMTAGKGIIHSEMPEQEQGMLSGLQLWVNLPQSKKMSEPKYQEHADGQILLDKVA